MDIGTALVALTGIGCAAGVVCMVVDKLTNRQVRSLEAARQIAEERLALRQQRVADLELQNRQLQQQLDWHSRLSEGASAASLPPAARAEDRVGVAGGR